jgi:NAD(P)-dependent dehydrogenase (short-subunit alcohol dehydrogenase family)
LASDGINVTIVDLPDKIDALEEIMRKIEAKNGKAIAMTCDVSKEEEVQEVVRKTVDAFGGLDIVCNYNA